LPPHRIVRMGIARTFQDLRLITQVSVLDNVFMAYPNQCGERLLPALLQLGVAAEESRTGRQLWTCSGPLELDTQAQHIRRGTLLRPTKTLDSKRAVLPLKHILFLDEPVAGVARKRLSQILNLFRQLSRHGKTIIFIDTNIEAVRQVADHVIVMDNARS